MKNNKGAVNIWLVVVVVVVVIVVVGGYFAFKKSSAPTPKTEQPQNQQPVANTNTPPPSTPKNLFGKLPKLNVSNISLGAGGSGISIKPNSFVMNASTSSVMGLIEAPVYMYKTLFSSKYVSEVAKSFGMPLLETPPPCKSEVCDDSIIQDGVKKVNLSGAGDSWEISYGIHSNSNFVGLTMLPNGEMKFQLLLDPSSPLYELPKVSDPRVVIKKIKDYLSQYKDIFGDLESYVGEFQGPVNLKYPAVTVYLKLNEPKTIYNSPFINVDISVSVDHPQKVSLIVNWLSSKNKEVSIYGLRFYTGAWNDIKDGKGVVVNSWPYSNANPSITGNGLITGTFTANSISIAYGRVDVPAFQSFFLEPVYVFSGILDTGKQKLPLDIWASAAVVD